MTIFGVHSALIIFVKQKVERLFICRVVPINKARRADTNNVHQMDHRSSVSNTANNNIHPFLAQARYLASRLKFTYKG